MVAGWVIVGKRLVYKMAEALVKKTAGSGSVSAARCSFIFKYYRLSPGFS
jgi:hypothetical protein